jgi:hypothetical protein
MHIKVESKMFKKKIISCFCWGVVVIGFTLLFITIVGDYSDYGDYGGNSPRTWEKFEHNLVKTIKSKSDLIRLAQLESGDSPAIIMNKLYELVIRRFTHKNASHTLFSNFILYGMVLIHPVFPHIYDTEIMLSKGSALLCDQSSYLLLELAHSSGIVVRHVGLYGHVVMEAWYENDWHLYDPDLEVLPYDAKTDNVLSVKKISSNQILLEKYYGMHPEAVEIVKSEVNNTYMSYPELARWEWKSNVLVYFEKAMQVMKYMIPILFIVFGLITISKNRKNI